MAGSVLVVRPSESSRAFPRALAQAANGVRAEATAPEAALARLAQRDGVEALVLPPDVEERIAFAQRALALDPDVAVLFLCKPAGRLQVARALRSAPLPEDAVACVATEEDGALGAEVARAAARTRERRARRAAGLERSPSERRRAGETYRRDHGEVRKTERARRARAGQEAELPWGRLRALEGERLPELMEDVVMLLADALAADLVGILELLPGEEALLLRAGVGWREGLVGSAKVASRRDSHLGYALRSAEPVVAEDLAREPRFTAPALLREHGVASGMSVVIGGREPAFGVLAVHATRRQTFSEEQVNFLRAAANVLSAAVERCDAEEERAHLLALEQASRAAAERANEALRSLETVSEAALARRGLEDLLDELMARVVAMVDADTAAILLVDDESDELVARAARGLEEEVERGVRIPVGKGFAGRIAAEARPVFIEDVDHADILNPLLREKGIRSLLGVPLVVGGRVTGVLHVGTLVPRSFTHDDARLLRLVADRVALAVEQARLYEAERAARREAEAARGRVSFLAAASTALASSLDYEKTLTRVAQVAVSRLADWCAVYVKEDGTARQLAVAHTDPEKEDLAAELNRRYPYDPSRPGPVGDVLATGNSVLLAEIPDALVEAAARDDEHLELLRALGLTSAMIVPLVASDEVVGAISFVSADSGRIYTRADLALAEDLARRAALAVENARLYEAAEARGKAALALATIGEGVFLLDRQGIVRLWNPAAEAITGLPAARVLGRPAREAIPGWSEVVEALPVTEAPGPSASRPTMVPLEIEGRELWLSFSAVGFAGGTVYTFRDLTEERRIEELKSEFVGTASHELRTPLAAVYGAAMTLRRPELGLDDERRDLLLSVIADQSDRLSRIVNDLLWASRVDAGKVDVQISAVDPRDAAERVVQSARAHIAGGIDLELTAPEHVPPVAADEQKLGQVLTNLVENAIKYSPDGGRVEVSLAPRGGRLLISVRDEGLGIPKHEQARIFEKFYRLDPHLTKGVGGTGLGLYISSELVRRMNGRIWVESAKGEGSTFFVELPLAVSAS